MSLSESNRATPSAQLSPHAKSFRPNNCAPRSDLPNGLQAQTLTAHLLCIAAAAEHGSTGLRFHAGSRKPARRTARKLAPG